jgi:hypothetical protein
MIRLACFLILVSLAAVVVLAWKPGGPTAIAFTFVGLPALVLGIVVYAIQRWREGAFRNNGSLRKETP